jgi:uncharacterized protein YjiS (DUF1127 family)
MSNLEMSTVPRLTNPEPFGYVRGIMRKIQQSFATIIARRQLMALDDRMLKDIGLTRCDIEGNFWKLSRHPKGTSLS